MVRCLVSVFFAWLPLCFLGETAAEEEWSIASNGDWIRGPAPAPPAPPGPSPDNDDYSPAPDNDDYSPEPSGDDEFIRLDTSTTAKSCEPGCEITSAEECQRAIDWMNKKIGRKSTASNVVKVVSYCFYPPGCFTQCFTDYAGHFCPYFNTHTGKESYTSKDQWKFCKGTCGPQSMKVATDSTPVDPVQEALEKSAAEEEQAAMRAAEEQVQETLL